MSNNGSMKKRFGPISSHPGLKRVQLKRVLSQRNEHHNVLKEMRKSNNFYTLKNVYHAMLNAIRQSTNFIQNVILTIQMLRKKNGRKQPEC